MRGTGLPAREPDAECEACGARGTVGRAMRTDGAGHPTEIHRFCLACWPEHSARYRARWEEETRVASEAWLRDPANAPRPPGRGAAFEAATWHSTLNLVREIRTALRPPNVPTPDALAQVAQQIQQYATELAGDMPLEVEIFLREYGDHAG